MLAYLDDALERLVVRDVELGGPKVAVQPFDGPDDASRLEVEGRPRTFRVQGGAAEVEDGSDGAVRLFLLQCGAEAVEAGVAV